MAMNDCAIYPATLKANHGEQISRSRHTPVLGAFVYLQIKFFANIYEVKTGVTLQWRPYLTCVPLRITVPCYRSYQDDRN
jgi:hypothetical protein